jgi:proteasome activator subunit 4
VNSLASDCVGHLNEEAVHTDAYILDTPRLDSVLEDLRSEFSCSFIDQELLADVMGKAHIRIMRREDVYNNTVGETHNPLLGL